MSVSLQLPLDAEKLRSFCRKWSISELAVFGSVLRDDFGPASDVDFLASFAPEARSSLLRREEMQDKLSRPALVFQRVVVLS